MGSALPKTDHQMNSRTGIILLLAGLAVIMLAFELGSPLALEHLSRTERRVEIELQAASNLLPFTTDGRPTVLLAGNSLLLEGVQLDRGRGIEQRREGHGGIPWRRQIANGEW